MMNTTMNKCAMALTLGAVLGLCVTADAQRQRNQNQDPNAPQQDYTQNYGRGRGRNGGGFNGGGNNNFGGPNNFGGGGRNRRFNPNSPGIQAAEGDYSVIATKSIFLRDRRDRVVPQDNRIDPSSLPPEELLVVTGIVFEGGGFHAFVEHLLQGGITSLKVGDTIREGNREVGEVTEIKMDGLKFKKTGSTEESSAGVSYNLMGTRIDSIQGERLRLQSLTGGAGGGGGFGQRQFGGGGNPGGVGAATGGRQLLPAATPAPLDPNSTLTIEERMRMRRMQEGQPGAQQVIVADAPPAVQEAPATTEEPAVTPPAQGASVNVDSLTNLTVEERMRLRRAQESGQ